MVWEFLTERENRRKKKTNRRIEKIKSYYSGKEGKVK
jgi:hypothetical protein